MNSSAITALDIDEDSLVSLEEFFSLLGDTNQTEDICSSVYASGVLDQESTTVNLSAIYDIMFMEPCQLEQYNEEVEECNTWVYYPEFPTLWNHSNCPDPCLSFTCPNFAVCDTSNSTEEDLNLDCICQMGLVMRDDGQGCIKPALFAETPRPVPTMSPKVAKAVTLVNKIGCGSVV